VFDDSTEEELREILPYAFRQRDELLRLLSVIYPAHLCRRTPDDKSDADWPALLCIHLPTGNVMYHIHEYHLSLFVHLVCGSNDWDGVGIDVRSKRLDDEVARCMK